MVRDSIVQVGDVIRLKSKYDVEKSLCTVVKIQKAVSFGEGGWISFNYVVLTNRNKIIHISEACISEIIRKK
jgi:hypothetical protein